MGEYEPNDSRNVTQKKSKTPGEPPRTGPREDAARERGRDTDDTDDVLRQKQREQQPEDKNAAGKPMKQPQQKGKQSQSQSQSGAPDPGSREAGIAQAGKEQMIDEGDPNTQSPGPASSDLNSPQEGPLAGDQPQAIDNPSGAARPEYDQYETNHPQNMHRESAEKDAILRRQAAAQDGAVGGFIEESEEDEDDEDESGKN